jgi:hypothetical protein
MLKDKLPKRSFRRDIFTEIIEGIASDRIPLYPKIFQSINGQILKARHL